jgi:glycosyltransferase involved in cell wall biosynthesis
LSRLQGIFDITVGGFADVAVPPHLAVNVNYPVKNLFRSKEIIDSNTKQVTNEFWEMIPNLINEVKPDYVIFSHDIWLFSNISQVRKQFPSTKFLGYITLDGDPPYIGWKQYFYSYDLLITPSEYSTNAIKDKWFDLDVVTVPYGVDKKLYKSPNQGKELLKEVVYHATNTQTTQVPIDMRKKFCGIFAGANSNRKNLTAIYWAWKEFEKGKDDVFFLLIAHSASPTMQVGSYPLECFTDTETMHILTNPIEEKNFAPLVAACDILLHPVLGEGFGLTVLESMACGTVPLVPDFSSLKDFCNKDNSFILDWVPLGRGWGIAGSVPVQSHILSTLEEAYKLWKENKLFAGKGQEAIKTAAKYDWDNTAKGIIKALDYVDHKFNKLSGKVEVIRLI